MMFLCQIANFSWKSFFNIAFFQQLITTFIAVGLGVITALWVDRIIKRFQTKKERPLFINALKISLEKNLEIINELNSEIQNENIKIPSLQLDSNFLDSIAIRKFDYIKSFDICRKIDEIKYRTLQSNYMLKLFLNDEMVRKLNSRSLAIAPNIKTKYSENNNQIENLINEVLEYLNK